MKRCKECEEIKSNSEFNEDVNGERIDICKECEDELGINSEDSEGYSDIAEYYNKD